ncbi:MAG TPA: hypothetical protein VEL07_06375 [Planctomycetota bacterium]|nr:hypothetical protein [Planctomycetota bacterium]
MKSTPRTRLIALNGCIRFGVVAIMIGITLGGCSSGNAERPGQMRAESTELRNNHARTVAAVAERDLRLRELAKRENATGTLAEIEAALAADLGEVDYLLSVYDDARSPTNFTIEKQTVRQLNAVRAELRKALNK